MRVGLIAPKRTDGKRRHRDGHGLETLSSEIVETRVLRKDVPENFPNNEKAQNDVYGIATPVEVSVRGCGEPLRREKADRSNYHPQRKREEIRIYLPLPAPEETTEKAHFEHDPQAQDKDVDGRHDTNTIPQTR